jgi:hypothetical protein
MIPALGGSMLIPTIENEVFTNVAVEMDDKRFLGCKFSGCTLRYEGGECSWDDKTIIDPSCRWEISGTAAKIVSLLARGGAIAPGSTRFVL